MIVMVLDHTRDYLGASAVNPRDVLWVVVVLALYPACRWFAAVKQRRRDW